MSAAIRIAVHMQPARDENGSLSFKAALPVSALFEKSLDKQEIERARAELESAYAELVAQLRAQRAAMGTRNVMAYWQFGAALIAFEHAHNSGLLFVDQLVHHLVRDVPFSETMILLCRRFRQAFPDPQQIDPAQTFTNYQRAKFDASRLPLTVRARGRPRRK